jgi:hypothetical protein
MTPEYSSYEDFYFQLVIPLKKLNPSYFRLDGRLEGSYRKTVAYFLYQDVKCKIDADTYLDKLDMAYEKLKISDEPFLQKWT